MSEDSGMIRRCPMWMKVLLVASLVANMAVLGMFLGMMSSEREKRHGADRQIDWIVRFVPDQRRADAERLFDQKRDKIRELYRDRSKYMEEVVAAIRAEPFAPETLQAAMRARRENSEARRVIIEDAVTELLQKFTPDERDHFADEMEERLKRWREKGGD